jgi:type VI secretion system protein ImpH
MAAPRGGKDAPLIEQLFAAGYRFDFFQAVRILERYYQQLAQQDPRAARRPTGHDYAPASEAIRFRALPAHSFPAGAIHEVRQQEHPGDDPELPTSPQAEMVVSFLGLTGPQGVLPQHYTTLMLQRVRAKDFSLRDFFDMFNHRSVSLFYRAWEKYRFPLAYERSQLEESEDHAHEDLFTSCLYALVGLRHDRLRERQSVPDPTYLYYAGHFSHFPRNCVSLERILAEYFGLPVEVEQFQGQWLYISPDDQSQMPSLTSEGVNCQLGLNVIVGARVWDVQSKLRIKLGPLSYEQFRRFMPTGDALRPICELARSYVGPEFDFDVLPVLRAADVPRCRLAPQESQGARLGWNSWVRSQPFDHDVTDAVFEYEE